MIFLLSGRNQALYGRGARGLTLIELLIALGIGAAVLAGALAVLNQLLLLVPKAENSMLAIRQVQNAGYWIDRDATSAQSITPSPSLFTISTATPLVISYVSWDAKKTTITYTVDAEHNLQRLMAITDERTGNPISSSQMRIAESISSITAQYTQPDPGNPRKILTVTIIAQVGNSSETRVYKISPRSY